jgi:hypothetical protein
VHPPEEENVMPLKGRVGRHTHMGGTQCQNWSDDQHVVVDLLNRISPSNGGAGGSLKARIVPGIASNELYNAIVAFENKHFPGQRSGFIDPGGKMYQKLEALAAAVSAPLQTSMPAVVPPTPPPVTPTKRSITTGERTLLRSIFEETLPYESLEVSVNELNLGGEDNSITPGNLPMFSDKIWCADFTDTTTVSKADRGTFVHELTHVWQYYHGITKLSAIWLAVRHLGDYQLAYPYDLSAYDDLVDFNIEQQAAIIEDWWRVTVGMLPINNIGVDKSLSSYNRYVDQVRSAGVPYKPLLPTAYFRH